MQLAEALKVIAAIGECAEADHVDADLRLAWIGHHAAEVMASAAGDYDAAELNKTKCNALSALMRMYVNAAARTALTTLKPIVIGGEGDIPEDAADAENAMGRAVWHRRFPRKGDL